MKLQSSVQSRYKAELQIVKINEKNIILNNYRQKNVEKGTYSHLKLFEIIKCNIFNT